MDGIAAWVFLFLVFPGIVFSTVLGLALTWVDRKVSALVQMRRGPPASQPFWDVLKLLGKEVVVPGQGWVAGFLTLPFVAFSAAALAGTLVWLALLATPVAVVGDLIVVLYLLAIPSLALILGGAASGNPLGAVGASREMKLLIGYELPFVMALLVAVFQKRMLPGAEASADTLSLGGILGFQAVFGSVIARPSGVLAFLVALFCAQAKLGFVPFDQAEAETEIGEGALIEYSGAALGFVKLTQAVLLGVLPALLVLVFWGGLGPGTVGLLAFAGKMLLIIVLFVLLKNTNPLVRIDQALRFFWGPAAAVALLALILARMGW
jgi:NADH-quinone oxidoreductase subunit H